MWHFIVSTFWGVIGFFALIIFGLILLIAEIFEWVINLIRKFSSNFTINQTDSDLFLLILVALFSVVFFFVILRERQSNKKANINPITISKNSQSQKDYASVIDRIVNQSNGSNQSKNSKERNVVVKPILIDDFHAKNPFVMIDVPLNLRDAFIKECIWLEKKIGSFPSEEEQKNILQSLMK